MSFTRLCFATLVAVSVLAASACRGSSVFVQYDLRSARGPQGIVPLNPTFVDTHDQGSDSLSNSISLGNTLNLSVPGLDYGVRARVTAGFGNLHANVGGSIAATTGMGFEGIGNVSTSAVAGWTDTLLFQSPHLTPGTLVVIHASVKFDGIMAADAGASPAELQVVNPCSPQGVCTHQSTSGASVRVDISGASGPSGFSVTGMKNVETDGVDLQQDLPPVIPFDIQAIVEQNNTFQMQLSVSGGAGGKSGELIGDSANAVFLADIGETVAWGGISSVTNAATGETIDNWTITSASGFDYSKPFPVPEPSSVLLLAALVLVGGVASRPTICRQRS